MKFSYKKIIPLALTASVLFCSCAAQNTANAADMSGSSAVLTSLSSSADQSAAEAVNITLSGSSAKADSDAVSISGSVVTITEAGTYILSGSLEGSVIVDADKEDKVQLVLDGVTIKSDTFAAIYVAQADSVTITLSDGTKNYLSNGGSFVQIDDNDVDAVIFAKDDLTLSGTGTLEISSPAGHGIVGKDDVTITDGDITISAAKDGIHANDQLQIDGGSFDISGAEGLEATHVLINDGTISISATDDGVNAAYKSDTDTPVVEINGGELTIAMGSGDTDGIDSNGDIVINGGTISITGQSAFDYDGSAQYNGGTIIVNGETVNTITNQMMGGGMFGRMGGGMPNR